MMAAMEELMEGMGEDDVTQQQQQQQQHKKKQKKMKKEEKVVAAGVEEKRAAVEYTEDVLKELQAGSKTGSEWFLKNVWDKCIVISDDAVYRWRQDITLWESVKKKPARIIGDMLYEIGIDVGRFSVCTSLWNHSITALTLPKEEFLDLLDKQHRHLLPVANNMCIDLRNCSSIPRTRDHMFTFIHIPQEAMHITVCLTHTDL